MLNYHWILCTINSLPCTVCRDTKSAEGREKRGGKGEKGRGGGKGEGRGKRGGKEEKGREGGKGEGRGKRGGKGEKGREGEGREGRKGEGRGEGREGGKGECVPLKVSTCLSYDSWSIVHACCTALQLDSDLMSFACSPSGAPLT